MNAKTLMLAAALSPVLCEAGWAKEVNNGWDATWFQYDADDQMVVAERTPSAAQVDWRERPAQVAVKGKDLKPTTEPATPRSVGRLDIKHLQFVDSDGDVVPALLCTPKGKEGPFPVVIAVHGLTSNKAQICAQIAPELAKRGFAVLAFDLPRHGERPGEPRSVLDTRHSFQILRQAVRNVRQCIDLASTRPELNTEAGVTLAGYSLGCWINAVAGPADERVNAMALMVGGAHDIPAAAMLLPQVAAGDPRMALPHFAGRPVLLVNAKEDYVVTPDMGKRLFEACAEPKKQLWYDCGHLLCEEAYVEVAKWVEKTVKAEAKAR